MTIKKAIEHLKWKYRNKWNPTQLDVDVLNTFIEFVEEKHKKQLQDYNLFAKLYIMVYAQFLDKYKATVFDDIPKKELSRYLDQPLEVIIQRFTDKLNESELYELFKDLNIEMKHPALKSESIKNKETDLLEKALKEDDNLERFTGHLWDYETVKDNLELQINSVIEMQRIIS